MTELFLGVDGGGTKTEFVCINTAGAQLATATVGTTYHPGVGFDTAVMRIAEGVNVICAALDTRTADIRHAFFGLPGYGEDNLVDPQLHAACGMLLKHTRYHCGNDMVCGWAGSLACEDGINIVAGTGSIGYGERQGAAARVGGWGEVFGDEGSAYWIAVQGLTAFSRMSDGREVRGPLYDLLNAHFALDDDIQLIEKILGSGGMARADIAALAPVVVAASAAGDPLAKRILEQAAIELAAMTTALRSRLGYEATECVQLSYSGSVLTKVKPVRDTFRRLLVETGNFAMTPPRYSPSYGAAIYARKLAGR